jgi:hypothetical protein
MPFKMIANRSVYRANEGKEYRKASHSRSRPRAEKNRLLRTKRARADDTKTAQVKPQSAEAAPVVQKVVTQKSPLSRPQSRRPAENSQPSLARPNRYRRSDMRPED